MQSVEGLFDAAASDRVQGAAEIERRLIDGLLADRKRWADEGMVRGAKCVLAGQPAMANLRNLARWVTENDLSSIEELLVERSRVLAQMDGRLAEAAWPAVKGCCRVLTISRSSAVAAILVGAWNRGWRGDVVVFDGSSAGCGEVQASRLAKSISIVRSQPDAVMASWVGGGESLVVIGADAVSSERLVNACGTRTLLELARARSVPAVVAADSGKDLPDEEIEEILAAGPIATEEGTSRRWPIFEAAPIALVSERIAE